MQIKKLCFLLTIAATGGCATNPQTGRLEVAASVKQGVTSIKNQFVSIYDSPDPCSNNSRNIGVTVGALFGAFIGHELGAGNSSRNNTQATLLGAALGAGAGGLIGHDIDVRRCALARIAKENQMTLVSAAITPDKLALPGTGAPGGSKTIGLDVAVKNDGAEFMAGSSVLTPKAVKAYGEIADQYRPKVIAASTSSVNHEQALSDARNRKVLIVGHADETSDPKHAAELSDTRAKAVAELFAAHGVPASNIYYQGAGDTLPVASNNTSTGRSENRRVQIVDVPSQQDLDRYLSLRTADPRSFSGVSSTTSGTQQVAIRKSDGSRLQRELNAYDFGGEIDGGHDAINIGALETHTMFSMISSANAAPILIGSCRDDHPHISTAVQNLATGATLSVRDAMPGLYGAPIAGMMNGNYIAILDPYAPKDAGISAPPAKFEVYRDYAHKRNPRPSYARNVLVNVYRGSEATLYRMFVGGPMICMDLVVPKTVANESGRVYYQRAKRIYVAQSDFKTIR